MSENSRIQKQYDHRLRQLIQNTRDLDLAVRHGVPRSTARGWLKQSRTDVISIDVLDMDAEALQREVLFLRRRVTRILTMLHLVVVAIKVAEFSFDRVRIPDGTQEAKVTAGHGAYANAPATSWCAETYRYVEHSLSRMAGQTGMRA